jgi:hypothetical protein
MSANFERHLVPASERAAEFERLCALQSVDPEELRRRWETGELDPDAGYDDTSPYFGKDIAGLVMLLDQPLHQPVRRA